MLPRCRYPVSTVCKHLLVRSSSSRVAVVCPSSSSYVLGTTTTTTTTTRRRCFSTEAITEVPPTFPPSLATPSLPTQPTTSAAAWRTRGQIVEAGTNTQKLLALANRGGEGMDVHNKVILVSRLALACEGKEVQEVEAVRGDVRFGRLVEGLAMDMEGGQVVLTEMQVQSLKDGLRGLGVVVGV